jgi:molybdopterin-containing oxidoreductase family membrane subunit
MLEKALTGGRKYWALLAFLCLGLLIGFLAYMKQYTEGLTVTGMSRDVPWGFYIAQFTFLVGVAASAVMVVLPYYLHDFKAFSKLVILGEFLAIPAVIMCMLFIFVDMGQPMRVANVILHPTLNSMMFWDMLSLMGYLFLNILISQVTFGAHKKGAPPPKWIKPIIILSIPWAVSIHTVTAFLYAGLAGRPFWLTAILAPRFLASAFAAGPSLLLLLALLVRKTTGYDVGKPALKKLGEIITYAMVANCFFIGLELFTALYSDIPEHVEHFHYLFVGIDGKATLVPWMWTSVALAIVSLVLLLNPKTRGKEGLLAVGAATVILSIWIDKGLGMVVTGFVPSVLATITEYWPTWVELAVSLGVYSLGALILTVLYKVATTIGKGDAAH